MRSPGRGASHGSQQIKVDPKYLSRAERVFTSRLVKLGERHVTTEQLRLVVRNAENLAFLIQEIEMLDRTGLLRRLMTDLAHLQEEFRGDRLTASLRKALGRQVSGGPRDKFQSSWYVVPALVFYMRYTFGDPRWEWISNWISVRHGRDGHDAYDWWQKERPKTRGAWDGLRPEKRLLAWGAAKEFIQYAEVHYLDHHAPQEEIQALFHQRWTKLNDKIPCPVVTIVRKKPCERQEHTDRRLPARLVRGELPFVNGDVVADGQAAGQEIFLAGKDSGCSLMTIRTKVGHARRGRVRRRGRAEKV